MRIPKYCGSKEFHRSLNHCAEKIESVLDSFDHGACVCQELIKWRDVKLQVKAAAINDELECFSWE